jgi:hypothetical protein
MTAAEAESSLALEILMAGFCSAAISNNCPREYPGLAFKSEGEARQLNPTTITPAQCLKRWHCLKITAPKNGID